MKESNFTGKPGMNHQEGCLEMLDEDSVNKIINAMNEAPHPSYNEEAIFCSYRLECLKLAVETAEIMSGNTNETIIQQASVFYDFVISSNRKYKEKQVD